ncbi:hypothetical protein SRB5_39330 [Streptomyces sp. RB5]|uniref:Uncharacterized protein n=1 Tax=Streptomyces smaragdinus TaxID=2585196 RepID=A0A7K0CJW5_9ACTN|nr:hypothetical protein [Streptomyces smaragdinus]
MRPARILLWGCFTIVVVLIVLVVVWFFALGDSLDNPEESGGWVGVLKPLETKVG